MTCEKPTQSNVVVLKDNILVQVTKNYHVPFKLSVQEAKTLWCELDVALGQCRAKEARTPWCTCTHKRARHADKVGKCLGAYCECKKYDLDVKYYRPSENYYTDDEEELE